MKSVLRRQLNDAFRFGEGALTDRTLASIDEFCGAAGQPALRLCRGRQYFFLCYRLHYFLLFSRNVLPSPVSVLILSYASGNVREDRNVARVVPF